MLPPAVTGAGAHQPADRAAVWSRRRNWRCAAAARSAQDQLEELDFAELESVAEVEAGAGLLSAAGLLSVAGAGLAVSPDLDSDAGSEDAALFGA